MEGEVKLDAEVAWRGGRKISTLPLGLDGQVKIVITEYFTMVERKLVPGATTMKMVGKPAGWLER